MTDEQLSAGRTTVKATVRPSAQLAFEQSWSAIFDEPTARQPAVHSVLFAAAGRLEGASTLVAGTALSGAHVRDDLRIALLDLNFRQSRLARMLGAAASPGLAEVLAGQASAEGIAQPVGSDNLTLYPAGEPVSSPMSLLAGARLRELCGELAGRHDRLLCDCAAANVYPDVKVLAGLFDGVVLVAQSGVTRREALAEAKKAVEAGGGRLLGVILNKRRYPVPRFLYRRG